jgi:hypothetical protein
MKGLTRLTICLLTVVFVHCHSGRRESTMMTDGKTTVRTSETETTFTLHASFDEDKAMAVYQFINSSITPHSLFTSADDRLDVSKSLLDGTTFQIKAYRGELTLTFDKRANSPHSYHRVKGLCEGVKKIVM